MYKDAWVHFCKFCNSTINSWGVMFVHIAQVLDKSCMWNFKNPLIGMIRVQIGSLHITPNVISCGSIASSTGLFFSFKIVRNSALWILSLSILKSQWWIFAFLDFGICQWCHLFQFFFLFTIKWGYICLPLLYFCLIFNYYN